jgi:hypothetical protein
VLYATLILVEGGVHVLFLGFGTLLFDIHELRGDEKVDFGLGVATLGGVLHGGSLVVHWKGLV